MRARKAATFAQQSVKVAELEEVQAELKVNPTAGVIPDKVGYHWHHPRPIRWGTINAIITRWDILSATPDKVDIISAIPDKVGYH